MGEPSDHNEGLICVKDRETEEVLNGKNHILLCCSKETLDKTMGCL